MSRLEHYKRKHCPYKPGSVPCAPLGSRTVPAIYLLRESPHGSSILPSIVDQEGPRTDNPQTMVYMNLQPPDGTARRSPVCWWSLTPPSHPYHAPEGGGGYFLLPTPTVANSFYFRKWSVLCCPDFPPAHLLRHASGRAGILLSKRKVTLI